MKTTLRGIDPNVPLPPGARGGITAQFLAPYEGDYELRAAGNPAVFTVDGATVDTKGRTHLTAGLHTHRRGECGPQFRGERRRVVWIRSRRGGNRLLQHRHRRGRRGRQRQRGGGGGRGGGAGITVNGPFNPTGNPVDTPSRTRIFVCRAPDPKEETACASRILSNLAKKAFRRPVTDKDLAPLMQFYNEGRKAGNV